MKEPIVILALITAVLGLAKAIIDLIVAFKKKQPLPATPPPEDTLKPRRSRADSDQAVKEVKKKMADAWLDFATRVMIGYFCTAMFVAVSFHPDFSDWMRWGVLIVGGLASPIGYFFLAYLAAKRAAEWKEALGQLEERERLRAWIRDAIAERDDKPSSEKADEPS